VEVPVRDEELVLDEHEWIVSRRVELDRNRPFDVSQEIACRPVDLGRAAERVRVLHLVAPLVRFDDRRAFEQAEDVGRGSCLTLERP